MSFTEISHGVFIQDVIESLLGKVVHGNDGVLWYGGCNEASHLKTDVAV